MLTSAPRSQVARTLAVNGKWLYITYRQPHFMRPLLEKPYIWDVQVETLNSDPGEFEYFGFVMTKHSNVKR